MFNVNRLIGFGNAGFAPAEGAVDPYLSSVVLLTRHHDMPDASSILHDISLQNFSPVTPAGNVQTDTAISKWGRASYLFDGTGDYASIPSNSVWAPVGGNTPYTWEGWLYPLAATTGIMISWYTNTGSQHSWTCGRNSAGQLQFSHVTASLTANTYTSHSAGLILNQWNHWAVCFDGLQARLFLNGILDPMVATLTDGIRSPSSNLRLGTMVTGGSPDFFLNGHQEDVRLSRGVARYNRNFHLPTQPFQRPSQNSLVVNFTGSNGSTSFTDLGARNFTLTAVGNAQIQSNKLELDGTGDYVTVPNDRAWNLDGMDFTIELFGVTLDVLGAIALSHYNATGNQRGWLVSLGGTGVFSFQSWIDGTTLGDTVSSAAGLLSTGVAYDLAVVREGNTGYLYIDGTLVQSGSIANRTHPSTAVLTIGATASGATAMNGRMAAVRITRGSALYTGASYTVPTLPLT